MTDAVGRMERRRLTASELETRGVAWLKAAFVGVRML